MDKMIIEIRMGLSLLLFSIFLPLICFSSLCLLRHVQPATVFWRVMDIKSFRQTSGFLGFECFVE